MGFFGKLFGSFFGKFFGGMGATARARGRGYIVQQFRARWTSRVTAPPHESDALFVAYAPRAVFHAQDECPLAYAASAFRARPPVAIFASEQLAPPVIIAAAFEARAHQPSDEELLVLLAAAL